MEINPDAGVFFSITFSREKPSTNEVQIIIGHSTEIGTLITLDRCDRYGNVFLNHQTIKEFTGLEHTISGEECVKAILVCGKDVYYRVSYDGISFIFNALLPCTQGPLVVNHALGEPIGNTLTSMYDANDENVVLNILDIIDRYENGYPIYSGEERTILSGIKDDDPNFPNICDLRCALQNEFSTYVESVDDIIYWESTQW